MHYKSNYYSSLLIYYLQHFSFASKGIAFQAEKQLILLLFHFFLIPDPSTFSGTNIIQIQYSKILSYMQNQKISNKQKKNKKINKAKQRNKKNAKFSFQDRMVDLLSSDQDIQEHTERQEEVIEEEHCEKNKVGTVQQMKEQAKNNKAHFHNNQYFLIVEIGKFYRVKKENQKGQGKILVNNQNEKIDINGSMHSIYSISNPFIFTITRQALKNKNIDLHYENIPSEIRNKIKKQRFHLQNQSIIRSSTKIILQETTQPWKDLPKQIIQSNDSLLIIGLRNTGKSTLSQYLYNKNHDSALLDCDIGRNSHLQGSISLTTSRGVKTIWIGQLSPLNNLQTYLRGIRYLLAYYNEHFFTKKLIVNTMGYLSGLGEFLLYQIYTIIKPKQMVVLQPKEAKTENFFLKSIISNIKSGQYLKKLYISQSKHTANSVEIFYHCNFHTQIKKNTARFQKMFQSEEEKVNSIKDLLKIIKSSGDKVINKGILKYASRKTINIYEQSRHGKQQQCGNEIVSYRKLSDDESVDMRIVILGKMINYKQNHTTLLRQEQNSGLFEVSGLGYGFGGRIYFKPSSEGQMGIVNEGIDFEKGFYYLNENQLIDIEMSIGRLPYIIVSAQGLGSKGVRNNPSKTV